MITLFRRIRQKLINSGAMLRYMLYAFGEILLVVIGILIALQVNNWNEHQALKNKIHRYYEQIDQELSRELPILEEAIQAQRELEALNKRSLYLLNTGDPDSLQQMHSTLGALGTAWTITYTYPALYEFLDSELMTSVEDAELKIIFQELSWWFERHGNFNAHIVEQYLSTIEPYLIRNVNYQNIAMDQYQGFLVIGGPQVDYAKFKGDLELWNMLTLKLETVSLYLNLQLGIQSRLQELQNQLQRYNL